MREMVVQFVNRRGAPKRKCARGVLLLLVLLLLVPLPVYAGKNKAGWVVSRGNYIYLNAGGRRVTGLREISNKYYYFDRSGVQRTGWRTINGEYYFFRQSKGKKGYMLGNTSINGISIGADGRALQTPYSVRKMNLMVRCAAILDARTNASMTKGQKLSAAFAYVRDLTRRDMGSFYKGSDWDLYYAEYILNRGYGNCYCQGALFAYMANACGYSNAKAVSSGWHGWAVVNGTYFDPNWANVIGTAKCYAVPASLSGVGGRPKWASRAKYITDLGRTGGNSAGTGGGAGKTVNAHQKGWNSDRTQYYYKKSGKLVKAVGLFKIGQEQYYFNKSGILQKNCWVKNLKVKGKKHTFYVGSKGTIVHAQRVSGAPTAKVIVKKIKGKQYGFDENGYLVGRGVYATAKGKAFFFNKNGVYQTERSKGYRGAVKKGRTSKNLLNKIMQIYGTPLQTKTSPSCNFFDYKPSAGAEVSSYTSLTLIYDHVEIILDRNDTTGVYYSEGVFPRDL